MATISTSTGPILEGGPGETSYLLVNVKLSEATDHDVTFGWYTEDFSPLGTKYATSSIDYVKYTDSITALINPTTFTIPTGDTQTTIRIPIIGDAWVESDETFKVILSNPTGASFKGGGTTLPVTCTIKNDEGILSVDAPKLTEGGPGQTSNMTFTVKLASAVHQDLKIGYTVANITAAGAAAAGADDGKNDYNSGSGTLTITKGATSGTITVPVYGDSMVEGNETFGLDLTLQPYTASGSDYGAVFKGGTTLLLPTYRAIGTIVDDEATITVDAPKINEGSFGQTPNMTFTVKLAAAVPQDVTVNYALADGTAKGAAISGNDGIHDYDNSVAGQLKILANSLSGTIAVPIFGDSVYEGNETFTLTLSNPLGGSFKGGVSSLSTTGTIIDDESLITVDAPKTVEGGLGDSSTMTFTVKLSAAVPGGVTVNYSTADKTAAALNDYTPISGTIVFTAIETSKTIPITILGDARVEGDESLILNLSNPTGAIFKGGGTILPTTGTITDDEGVLTVDAPKITEGNSGSKNMTFTVTLANPVLQDVTMNYSTLDITAAAGSDYTKTTGTLVITKGGSTGTITVPILNDTIYESDETFGLSLSLQNVTPSDPLSGAGAVFKGGKTTYQTTGTILNDEGILSVDAPKVTEGGVGDTNNYLTFTIKLAAALSQPATVSYVLANGTATGTSSASNDGLHDYDNSTSSGTLTIAANSLTTTLKVPVFGDSKVEGSETVNLILSNPSGAGFKGGGLSLQTTGTVLDDEGVLTASSVSVKENIGGASGQKGMMAFVVKLAAPLGQDVTLHYHTADNPDGKGATGFGGSGWKDDGGYDYTSVMDTLLTIPKGFTQKVILIPIWNDTAIEGTETFSLILDQFDGAGLKGNASSITLVGTITDDEPYIGS